MRGDIALSLRIHVKLSAMSPRILQLLLTSVSLVGLAFAQSDIGGASLNGTVTDPSGAAVANAKVTAENTITRLTRTTQSSDAGLYSFPHLTAGSYNPTLQAAGFTDGKPKGI